MRDAGLVLPMAVTSCACKLLTFRVVVGTRCGRCLCCHRRADPRPNEPSSRWATRVAREGVALVKG